MLGCTSGQTCFQSKCCDPKKTCDTGACGDIDDGCGGTIPCGGCTNGRVCKSSQCQCDGTDTDGDGLTDCQEIDDGDDWTDPNIFNGLVAATYDNCTDGKCSSIDTTSEVAACTGATVVEKHNVSAGWAFNDNMASRCDAAYGFTPNWTQSCSDASFSVSYTGFINLKAGTNCFDIGGTTGNTSCGVFMLDNSDSLVVTQNSGPKCFPNTTAGAHAVTLFFDRAAPGFLSQTTMGFKWELCNGGNSNCTPTAVVPQSAVRVSN
jgi:hypothetical protein